MRQPMASFLSASCALTLLCGCDKTQPSMAVYPISGVVRYHDKPLSGAAVWYMAFDGGLDDPRSSGITDAEGRFKLTTYVSGRQVLDGARPGEYTVIIMKQSTESNAATDMAKIQKLPPDERAAAMKGMRETGLPKPKWEIPEKYTNMKTSDLRATVVAGTNPPVEFNLHD